MINARHTKETEMPSVVKQKIIQASKFSAGGRKSGICLSGSQLNLTQRPSSGNMTSRSASPVKSAPSEKLSGKSTPLKKQRPKSALPTISRRSKATTDLHNARPLSANVPTAASSAVDSNLSSPSFHNSDEISIWVSEEMLRAENKSYESTSSTKLISPFSDTCSSDSEKAAPKHLRFADQNSEDFISSVVEQLKEQVKFEITSESEFNKKSRSNARGRMKKKPKSIAELLEIIDNEIPIELKSAKRASANKNKVTPTPKNVEISTSKNAEIKNKEEAQNLEVNANKMDSKVVSKIEEIQLDSKDEQEDLTCNLTCNKEKKSLPKYISRDSSDCLGNIFNFLDEIEKTEHEVPKLKPLRAPDELELAAPMKSSKQIEILKSALEEKTAHVQLLKETLLQTKVETADALAASDKEHRILARKQKLEYETALKKLQDGMEKLIADKKSLVDKVEELVQKLRETESKHLSAIQALQQRQTVEIARTKQIAAASEKVRREKWVERQTARIKELTVKGLEPELTRLNLQHENKIALMQAGHSKELQAQVEAENRRVEEVRSLMLQEKDHELARERCLMAERHERQLAEERAMMEIRCERIKEEAASEAARQQANWNAQKEAMISQAWQETQRVQGLHDQQILLLDEKKQAEIAAAKEELREEQAAWLTAQNRKNSELLAAKQQELKEQRDKEIDRAIERLESEERRSRSEIERETEKKIQRLKEQHRAILADRDLNEKLLSARLSEAQKSMEDSEKQMLAARANEGRLKQELCISVQRVQALEGEHSRIKELVEKQFSRQISDLDNQIKQLKEERETELLQVHARLKGVLEKKEHHIEQLKTQEAELTKRCKHLESLLGR